MRKHNRSTVKPDMSRNNTQVATSSASNPQHNRERNSHRHFTSRGNHSSSADPSRLHPHLIHPPSAEPEQENKISGPHSPPVDPLRSQADNRGPHSPPGESNPTAQHSLHQEHMHRISQSKHPSHPALSSTSPSGNPAPLTFQAPNQDHTHPEPHPDRLVNPTSNKVPMHQPSHQDPLRRHSHSSPGQPVRLALNSHPIGHESHSPSSNPSHLAHGTHPTHRISQQPPISNAAITLHPSHEHALHPESHSASADAAQFTITPPSEPERLGLPRSPGGGHSGNTSPVMQYCSAPKVQSIPKHPPTSKPAVDTTHFVMVTYTNLSISPRLPPVSRDLHQPLHAAALALHSMASVPHFPRLPPPSRITVPARQHHDPRASVAHLVHPRDSASNLAPPPSEVRPILPSVSSAPVAQDAVPVAGAGAPAAGGAVREFRCHFGECTKSFDRRYNLKVHYRRHTNETPYPCKVTSCPQKFKWRSSLAHHMRTRHKGVTITRPPSSSSNGRGEGSPPSVAASSSNGSSRSGGSSPNSPLSAPVRPGKVRRVGLTSFAAAVAAASPRESQGKGKHSGHGAFVGGAATTVCDSDEDHVSTPEFEQRQTAKTADSPLTDESRPGTSSKRSHDQMRDEARVESR